MGAGREVGDAAAAGVPPGGRPVSVRLTGIGKTYGCGSTRMTALHGVDLDVRAGEFVVLLGPSGSGKTTLLNIIGGIDAPTEGTIEVAGADIGRLNDKRRTRYRRDHVGFVFQFFNLVATLTVTENVEVIAELAGPGARARSLAALERVGIGAVAERFPAELSGGQQQRVAIARAIVKNPPLLLCDEPTGSLDLVTGRQVLTTLGGLARTGRHTVVVVTHNSEIARMADRVLWLHSGTISKTATVRSPVGASELDW